MYWWNMVVVDCWSPKSSVMGWHRMMESEREPPDVAHHGCHDTTIDSRRFVDGARVDNDYLGANPGGTLGTVQANPCCWLTPIGS